MEEISIGFNILVKRKEKGITQEELADFIGVSKSAVSKWESNQSYPDITLLPIIATYFDISVDELIGYHPQLTKEKIKSLYLRLSDDFSKKSFDEVYDECMDYAKKYYSCFRLQFNIALLLINHVNLVGDKERTNEIYKEAEDIFERIIKNSKDSSLCRQATYLKATCLLMTNRVGEAIINLESITELSLNPEILLANAYEMKGDTNKAVKISQEYIYGNVIGILGAVPSLIRLYGNDIAKVEKWIKMTLELSKIFNIKEIYPSSYLSIYYITAYIYVMNGKNDKAINMLENYVRTISNTEFFPIKLKTNEVFDCIEGLFEKLDLGNQSPRNEKIIKEEIKKAVIDNPVFKPLEKEEKFNDLIKRLKDI
ncbi:DNA-binding transcriptional regulator, XRE-family HTH domain [Clostridium cavendishii DSM 21758]|uniref:DNA-binding transcriptional regulator, XRE-family HTH domain n=1 Tax=Clostridium cavendishii DSM 21758 TaxID=1121302 RepID=A0A1M6CCA8_9CLOT|nr:helix-turn-helix domain-containing protein [Clostridium cavendishii]SHI58358.1 DNA-binding transcriptional regulator, XRE-family HTH domain [Clostridium cavendishii DSM 21758]